MGRKAWFTKVVKKARKIPKKYYVGGGIIIAAIIYGTVFFIPKPIVFSYTDVTCTRQLTLLPGLHKASNTENVKTTVAHGLKIGDVPIITATTCFTARTVPKTGVTTVKTSPFGGWLMQNTFAIQVGDPPQAAVTVLNKQVPLSKPLILPLSQTDKVFSYSIKVDQKTSGCIPKEKAVSCDLKNLNLSQGASYPLEVIREFKSKKVGTIAKKDITILPATKVIDTSVKSGETVYAKPKNIELIFDKNITKIKVKLYKLEAQTKTLVPSTVEFKDTKANIVVQEDLLRLADYEAVIESVEAKDGSGLESPYVITFKTSGGPKVTNVSVPSTSITPGATMVITFDQPLSEKQDINKIVTLTGGAAITARKANQLHISLANVPKCGDFKVVINNDLQSNYDISGNTSWSFNGRVRCYTTSTIGYSSKGRAIIAYHFGSGPSAVLYTGAIHGNELSTKYLMEKWTTELEANARNIPANKSVVVIPQINPDGVASGGRTNARNVDLNRNFATSDWRRDTTTVNNQPFPNGGGVEPMSEPETRVLARFVQSLRPSLVLSYHSIGGVVVGNQAGNSSTLAGTYAQLSGYGNATGQTSETFDYSVSGTADDWYGEKLSIASIVIELSSHSSHQFSRNQKAMWAMMNQ